MNIKRRELIDQLLLMGAVLCLVAFFVAPMFTDKPKLNTEPSGISLPYPAPGQN